MDLPEGSSVALLPIKPVYATAIIEGRKRVEFRKTKFRRPVTHVAIYASTPVQRIIGIFRVGDCEEAAPHRLWQRHRAHGAITSDDFNAYFADVAAGVAIHIADVTRLSSPLPLARLRMSAPQSFCYLDDAAIARLRAAISTPRTRKAQNGS